MGNEIVISLEGAATAKKYKINELFQKEKFEEIKHIFNVMLKEITGKDCSSIEKCRNHDTIFIDGERGIGKTAFLLNIENYIKENEDKKLSEKLKFFKPIDPTLLEDSENFISIVIARIVEETNKHLCNTSVCYKDKEQKQSFFENLNKLSDSIAAIKNVKEDRGIDEIASYASSIQLENNIHHFLKSVADIFGVEKLVMLIDDVDMAFDKGFEVLEVIRKYMSSPYIVPIVAGDYKLYEDIVRNRFRKQFTFYKDEYKIEIENKINNLTEQYLNKVFPLEFRVELKNVKEIIKNSDVKVKIQDTNENNKIDFNKLLKFEQNSLNIGINREKEQFEVIEYNPRQLVKYLYRKKDVFKEFKDNIENNTIPDINKLKQSYEATAEFYKYSVNEEKRLLSKLLENDINSFKDGIYDIYEAFRGLENFKDDNGNYKFVNRLFNNNRIYKSSYIKLVKLIYEAKIIQYIDIRYLFELFKFEEYINEYQTSYFIIPQKFLRLIFLSLNILKFKNIIEKIKEKKLEKEKIKIDEEKWDEDLLKKMKNYYMIENISDKIDEIKEIIENDKDLEEEMISLKKEFEKIVYNSELIIENNCFDYDEIDELKIEEKDLKFEIDNLIYEIILWHYNFIEKNYMNSTAMYKNLEKFFKNFSRLEIDFIKKNNNSSIEKLISILQRIILMFINSVAFFENKSYKVSRYDFAVSKKFNLNYILKNTPASFFNIKPVVIGENNTLTKALFFHPLISYIILFSKILEEKIIKKLRELDVIPENYLEKKTKITGNEKKEILNELIKAIEEKKLNDLEIVALKMLDIIKEILETKRKSEELKELIEEINKKIKEAQDRLNNA